VSLFYKLLIVVLVTAALVFAYDLFQVQVEKASAGPRIRFDPETGRFTFRKPDISVRIIYASMFGPGEPVMRVRDLWISMFEEEYSDYLAARCGVEIPQRDKAPFVRKTLRAAAKALPHARRILRRIDQEADEGKKRQQIRALQTWLAGREIRIKPLDARAGMDEQLAALRALVAGLEALRRDPDPAGKVDVRPWLVKVDRRWQGRWVLTANRPRYLTGREVPDVIVGSKMELFALVQDDYAVALNDPLPGHELSPLDEPDTWADPSRRWRDAFIPTMLKEGTYTFLKDRARAHKVYLAPLRCTTFCIFYNEVLFEKAGVKPPKTWPEFIQVCETLKKKGITPLTADAEVYCDNWQTWLIFRVLGPDAWERTITGVPTAGVPAGAVEAPEADKRGFWAALGIGLAVLAAAGTGVVVAQRRGRRLLGAGCLLVTLLALSLGGWGLLGVGVRPVRLVARKSDPPWTDPRYQAVYQAIRQLRARGYFKEGFRGSKWPAAQRGFARGDAAMMICGTWLYQELGGYKDLASADVFRLNCFSFPTWPAPPGMTAGQRKAHEIRQKAFWAGVSGLMVCRQGKATEHAIELVKYLSARDHPYLVHWNGLISCMKDADFPPPVHQERLPLRPGHLLPDAQHLRTPLRQPDPHPAVPGLLPETTRRGGLSDRR